MRPIRRVAWGGTIPANTKSGPTVLREGLVIGDRFELIRQLGMGAVGAVWLAKDRLLDNEEVACKFLLADLGNDQRAVIDLKREVLLARKLRHHNIVGIHTFWELHDLRFITMEYIDGPDMRRKLEERKHPFTLAEIMPWVRQLCEALDYAHDHGILHRDIKPSNILVDAQGDIRIADFGIACTAHEARARKFGHATSGTLLFMSPEQLTGDILDRRTDLYSLAAAIYELLQGETAFHEGSIIAQIQFTIPAPIPHVPNAVNKVILKAMAKRPNDRYPSCGAFFEAFATAAATEKTETTDALPTINVAPRRADPDTETVRLARVVRDRHRLGNLLLEAGAISREQLYAALDHQRKHGGRLGTLLVSTGALDEEAIAKALEQQLQMPIETPDARTVDTKIAGRMRNEWLDEHGCLPLRVADERLVVAMTDPLDFAALNDLETEFGIPVEPHIITPSALAHIRQALES